MTWLIAAALVIALTLSGVISGCGGAKVDQNTYSVKQSGKTIGSQTVKIEEAKAGIVYTGVEKMPASEFAQTDERTFTAAKDLKSMVSYRSVTRVPGAAYTTWIASVDQGFSFLDDKLQVFSYVPLLPQGKSVLPIEPQSVCLLQAMLDRFLAAGVTQANAFVIVPSRGAAVRQVLVERRTQFQMFVSGQGLEDIDVAFDKNSFVTSVRTGSLLVQKGSPGSVTAKAYAPQEHSGRVEAVSVRTPEKLKDGGNLELAGSMYLPKSGSKPFAAAILTGDAGPQDSTGGGFLSQIADSLAGQGFAVLTCARRGIPDSAGDYATITEKTLVSDVNSQVDYLVNRGDINTDKIALVGYGEGGLLSAAAAGANPYVKKVVLMATPAVTMFPDFASLQLQLAVQQGRLLPEEAAFEQGVVDGLVGLVSGTTEATLEVAGHKVFLDWMRSWMGVKPAEQFAALKTPVLVMQGTTDSVVPPAQATEIMNVLGTRPGGVQNLETFDGLGHAFGRELSESQSLPFRQHPVIDKKVLDALATWLKGK